MIVTASKIKSDFIHTMHFYFSISQFHFCKAFNYNENIMIFVRSRLFYGFTPWVRLWLDMSYELFTHSHPSHEEMRKLTIFEYRTQLRISYFIYLT